MSDNSKTEEGVTDYDARAIVRLLGKVASVNGSLSHKRKLLMDGLCELIDVDFWHWSMIRALTVGNAPSFSVFLKGGFTDQQFADYLKAQEHPDMAKLSEPFILELAEKKEHLTRLRQQIDKEGRFSKMDVYELWRKADAAPLILSLRPIGGVVVSAVSLFRRFDRELFTPRESRIAHIILSEIPWLHDEAWPKHPGQEMLAMSPRKQTVVNLLLQGYVRKEIADTLNISINTVSGYVKEIYQHLDVHSQAELIRKFVEGDGGDMP